MKKEFYDMRTRSILTLIIMTLMFFSIAPLQNYAIKMLYKYEDQYNKTLLNDWSFYIYSQWFGKNLG